jgi:alpha-amylase
MKTLCFYFQVHQPFRLKNYRFFNIGHDHYYYDDYANESIIRKIAENCYLPANEVMLGLIKKYGDKFKISYSISGSALDQFELYAPEVLESFKKLAQTGSVEFLSESYSHSLAALKNESEFIRQIELHKAKIKEHFGQEPKVFRNTELIYSDAIGETIANMGYKAMLTEGAKHVLGWKSPNYLYFNAHNPKLKILLKNFKLSDDIAFRFSNEAWEGWPLTADKFAGWLKAIDKKEEVVNLFMDYETFGEHQWKETGIFDFLKALPAEVFKNAGFKFATPSEVADSHQPIAAYNVPYPISWADEERDLTAWLGNELQNEAFDKLYEIEELVSQIDDKTIQRDWLNLQNSDHFYYMCTKFFSDGAVHGYFNPYDTPYQAFINYMNVLSDFKGRLCTKTKAEKPVQMNDISGLSESQVKALIKKYEKTIDELKDKLKPKVIDKTKPATKAISKTKVKAVAIEKTKEEKTAISATKKTAKPISKTKKENIAIEEPKTKKTNGTAKKKATSTIKKAASTKKTSTAKKATSKKPKTEKKRPGRPSKKTE